MKKLLKEMEERMIYLESLEKSDDIISRINELSLAIIRVQQILLKDIKKLDTNQLSEKYNIYFETSNSNAIRVDDKKTNKLITYLSCPPITNGIDIINFDDKLTDVYIYNFTGLVLITNINKRELYYICDNKLYEGVIINKYKLINGDNIILYIKCKDGTIIKSIKPLTVDSLYLVKDTIKHCN